MEKSFIKGILASAGLFALPATAEKLIEQVDNRPYKRFDRYISFPSQSMAMGGGDRLVITKEPNIHATYQYNKDTDLLEFVDVDKDTMKNYRVSVIDYTKRDTNEI